MGSESTAVDMNRGPARKDQLRLLLELQDCDAQLQQLRQRRATLRQQLLPQKAKLALLAATLDHKRQLFAAASAELEQEPRVLEKARRQVSAVIHELRFAGVERMDQLARLVREAKNTATASANRVLALKAEVERTRLEMIEHERESHAIFNQIEEARPDLDATRMKLDALAGRHRSDRAALVEQIDEQLLLSYVRLRVKRYPRVVMAVDGVCSGCQRAIPPALARVLARSPAIQGCPSCGRLIFPSEVLSE